MNERHYVFELECPRCHKLSATTGTRDAPPPQVNCGECLFDRTEVVELKVIRIHVLKGAN